MNDYLPTVDVKDGRCVRLVQNEFDKVTVYSDDPWKWRLNGKVWVPSTFT